MEQQQRSGDVAVRAWPFREWCRVRGIGVTTGYEELKAGAIRTYKVGRNRFVSVDADREWQAAKEAA